MRLPFELAMNGTFHRREKEAGMESTLSSKEHALIDAYWRAANYLSVGQIYLYDNPAAQEAAD